MVDLSDDLKTALTEIGGFQDQYLQTLNKLRRISTKKVSKVFGINAAELSGILRIIERYWITKGEKYDWERYLELKSYGSEKNDEVRSYIRQVFARRAGLLTLEVAALQAGKLDEGQFQDRYTLCIESAYKGFNGGVLWGDLVGFRTIAAKNKYAAFRYFFDPIFARFSHHKEVDTCHVVPLEPTDSFLAFAQPLTGTFPNRNFVQFFGKLAGELCRGAMEMRNHKTFRESKMTWAFGLAVGNTGFDHLEQLVVPSPTPHNNSETYTESASLMYAAERLVKSAISNPKQAAKPVQDGVKQGGVLIVCGAAKSLCDRKELATVEDPKGAERLHLWRLKRD